MPITLPGTAAPCDGVVISSTISSCCIHAVQGVTKALWVSAKGGWRHWLGLDGLLLGLFGLLFLLVSTISRVFGKMPAAALHDLAAFI